MESVFPDKRTKEEFEVTYVSKDALYKGIPEESQEPKDSDHFFCVSQ